MTSRKTELLIGCLTVGVLVVDWITPRGWLVPLFYLPAILGASRLTNQKATVLVAAICSVLTIIGFVLDAPGIPWPMAALNRVTAILLFWMATWFLIRTRNMEQRLRVGERNFAQAQRVAGVGSWTLELTNTDHVNRNPLQWSNEVFRIFGYEPGQIAVSNENFFRAVHPDDRQRIDQAISAALHGGQRYNLDHRICLPNGTERVVHEESDITYDEVTGQPIRMTGTIQDITERKSTERLLSEQRRILELIATGTPLTEVLSTLTLLYEQQFPGSWCSVLLLDRDQRLQLGAAPSLPEAYNQAIAGFPIGPANGSCGTAAYRRETVIVSEIATDPLWNGYQDLAHRHGLKSCWSAPIKTVNGEVLGTFAMYYAQPHRPTDRELSLVEVACHIAEIAIQRARTEDSIQKSELRYRRLFETAKDGILIVDAGSGRVVDVNPFLGDLLGYSAADIIGKELWELGALKDVVSSKAHFAELLERGYVRYADLPLVTSGGQSLAVEFVSNVYDVEQTQVIQCNIRDITASKQIEAALRDKRQLKEALQSAETLFRNLVENSLVGIHIIQDNRFAYVNPKLAEIFGYTPGEVLAMDSWLNLAAIEDRGFIANHVQQRISNLAPTAQYEFRGLRKDGTVIEVEVRGSRTLLTGRPAVIGSLIDITERKRAERALRESEERYRALVENAPTGVFVNVDSKFAYVNNALCRILGASSKEELLGKPIFDRIHPEYHAIIHRRVARIIHYGESTTLLDQQYLRLDGSKVEVQTAASPIVFHGQPAAQVMVNDITERKRAEWELRASESRFATIFRSSPVGICITTLVDGRFIDVNDAFLKLVGNTREEVLGHTAVELGYLSDPNNREKLLQSLQQTGSVSNSEHTFRGKDGGIHHALRSLERITLGGQECILALLNDITERKLAEESLRESEEQLRLTTTSSNTGLWDWDLTTNQVYYSPIWKRQIGYEDHEIPSHFEEWKSRVHPDDLEQTMATVTAYLVNPVSTYESEFRLRHKNGTYRWILAQGSIILDEQGAPHRLLGSHVDVTERKQAEQLIKQTADRLGILLMTSQLLASTLDLDKLLDLLLLRLTEVVPAADFAALYMYDPAAQELVPKACAGASAELFRQVRLGIGEDVAGRVLQLGHSVLFRNPAEIDTATDNRHLAGEPLAASNPNGSHVQSCICVPVRSQTGEVVGTLSLTSQTASFNEDDLSLLEAVTAQASIAIQNSDLYDEVRIGRERLQALSRQLLVAQEAERSHIARELHDEIGQVLTAVGFHLHDLVNISDTEHRERFEEEIALVDRAIQQVRDLSLDLRPPTLDLLGLEPTLRAYLNDQARRTDLNINFSGHLEYRLSPELEITCYRVVQTTVTNVVRHARARHIWVELQHSDDEVRVAIRDDGVGFDVAAISQRAMERGSFGLFGVRERVELVGGQLEIESVVGQGTAINARFPLRGIEPTASE